MDDICRTVLEVLERVNLCKYVDFSNRNSHEYDTFMISNLAILFKVFFIRSWNTNEPVGPYIKNKTHIPIILRFKIKSDILIFLLYEILMTY